MTSQIDSLGMVIGNGLIQFRDEDVEFRPAKEST
jgi:hypothetical protein